MLRPLKWLLRVTLFLAITFLFLISGIFDPLAESLRVPIARFMTRFVHDDLTLYADYYSDNRENAWLYIYVFLNVIVGIVSVAAFEFLAKLAKKSN
ncbi:hypothetical protein NB069_02805 [Leclercia adecarboxylata]|uniref:hypothetical protein n=1 Tax=Leclercia adecarboxylata TaxID=83655 RepID=UPI002029D4B5|nr:hypothetical protein [Leclercia adecarboxylata]URN99833.1 hypothetical protein NB069_02805 [Leclercia adecarboxylata]